MPSPQAFILTLGCPRNEVDSELFAGCLRRAGWRLTRRPESARLMLLNTCAFIAPAVEESLEAIDEAVEWKKSGEGRILILAGCLPGRYRDDGSGGLEDIDLLVGPGDVEGLAGFLGLEERPVARARVASRFDRYLKIAEGCLNRCSFCVLPSIRGPFVPSPAKSILLEAESLVGSGAREIGIIAQDPLAWSEGGVGLAGLASGLAERYPDVWFRLYYLHPGRFDHSVIEAMTLHRNIAPYVDLPVQHASSTVLGRMGRGYDRSRLDEIAGMIDSCGLEIACRFSVIAGYPGESEGDFDELCSFLRGVSSLRSLVVFPYWHEEGSREYDRGTADLVASDILDHRTSLLDSIAEDAAWAWGMRLTGQRVRVLAESTRRGRSIFDAPLVDGSVVFTTPVRAGGHFEAFVEECLGLEMTVSAAGIDRGGGCSDSSEVRPDLK